MLAEDHQQQLQAWFDTDLGQSVLAAEKHEIENIMGDYFGYHLLQVGGICNLQWFEQSPIKHKVCLSPCWPKAQLGNFVFGHMQELPFAKHSIDLAIMAHVLEFTESPTKVLEQITYALIPGGHIIILSFNPYSLWGIKKLLNTNTKFPWHGHFNSIGKLRKWLRANDCVIDSYKTFNFQLPIADSATRKKFQFVESIGQTCWPTNGAIYCLIARKQIAAITPITMPWRLRKVDLGKNGMTEPTTRGHSG